MSKQEWLEHVAPLRGFLPKPIDLPFMTLAECQDYTRNKAQALIEPQWEYLHNTVAEHIAQTAFERGVVYE